MAGLWLGTTRHLPSCLHHHHPKWRLKQAKYFFFSARMFLVNPLKGLLWGPQFIQCCLCSDFGHWERPQFCLFPVTSPLSSKMWRCPKGKCLSILHLKIHLISQLAYAGLQKGEWECVCVRTCVRVHISSI